MAEESSNTQVERAPTFVSAYANNVRFNLAALDLTMLFSQSRPDEPPQAQAQVTVSWPQAKVMLYFLQSNIAIYETLEGKIKIPKQQIPELPPPPADRESNPQSAAVYERLKRMHEEFIASL